MHDLHESQPLLYTYSGGPPQNPNLDPILFAELPFFSNFELAQMTKWGMPGVYTHAFMDGWSPGYLGSIAYNHNGMMRMYETQSGRESGPGGRGTGAAEGGGRGPRRGGRWAGARGQRRPPDVLDAEPEALRAALTRLTRRRRKASARVAVRAAARVATKVILGVAAAAAAPPGRRPGAAEHSSASGIAEFRSLRVRRTTSPGGTTRTTCRQAC